MRYLWIIIGITFFFSNYTSPIQACGGGANYRIEWLTDTDIIVQGTVIDVDDRGYNAIIRVHQYFKGDGGEYITVARYPSALEYVAAIRDYDTSCLYAGGGQQWIDGSVGYFGLMNNGNGTFNDSISPYLGVPHYYNDNGIVTYYSFDANTDIQPQLEMATTTEFEELLLEFGHRASSSAPETNPYPLMRFLNITTESGQRYRLNPDRSLTPQSDNSDPIAISNDGSHIVFRHSESELGFQYLSLNPKPLFEDITNDGGWIIPQIGENAYFSTDSNFVAVQEANAMTIYMFDNYESGGYGQRMTMQVIAQVDVSWLSESQPIVWSADSAVVAFQDSQGIWTWDLFEQLEPTLAVSDSTNINLLELSQSGQYVRYSRNDTWELLNLETGEVFERAIATPDESNLIYMYVEYLDDVLDINRSGERDCNVPLRHSCPIYIQGSDNFDYFWYKHNQVGSIRCWEEGCWLSSYSWQLSVGARGYKQRLDMPILSYTAFDYDIFYDQPVFAVEGYRLEFGFYPSYERDELSDISVNIDFVDLTNLLDSPIIELEWGQPIFYRHNH
ncbi:MAG: hypothetical protein AAF846_00520 [Chloroflexota bacterium]